MALPRRCTECNEPLTGSQKYTDTPTCRSKRSRRLKRERSHAGEQSAGGPEYAELRQAINTATLDVAHEVLKEEMRPLARAAITENTWLALQKMVGLTPLAVDRMEEDLNCSDPTIRQRAYTLLTKYTIGNQALIRPEDQEPGGLTVNFNLPRPGDTTHDVEAAAVELIDDETRTCDKCGEDKPVTQFVSGSHRCVDCYDEQRAIAASMM